MAELTLNDISLEDLNLPKGIITKWEDGSYNIDADNLLDFNASDRRKANFYKMKEKLNESLEKKYEKRKEKIDDKYANAETEEDEARLEKMQDELDSWCNREQHKIDTRMTEIKCVYDELIELSVGKIEEVRGSSAASGSNTILQTGIFVAMAFVVLGIVIA